MAQLDTKQNKIKEQIREIVTYHSEDTEIGGEGTSGYLLSNEQIDQLYSLYQEGQNGLVDDICRLLDDIELKNDITKGSTLEEWKQWKQIRNAIRDKYILKLVAPSK